MSPPLRTSSRHFALYPSADALIERFRRVAAKAGATEQCAGTSAMGRSLLRFDLGTPGRKVVLLSALMHGVEVVGSLALLEVLERLGDGSDASLAILEGAHVIALPVVNPDALFANMAKLERGERAWQRCNANGVDLNRNFPRLTTSTFLHPFAGSKHRFSPHYLGPHALSEPESRAIHAVASEFRPELSLAFHSFGNLLLYPWAYTSRPNERMGAYTRLADVMANSLSGPVYRARQARHLYPVLGDMDDWLDATFGTLALTVEVSRPDVSLRHGRDLLNPFCWMNPERIAETVAHVAPGITAMLQHVTTSRKEQRPVRPVSSVRPHIDFAAK